MRCGHEQRCAEYLPPTVPITMWTRAVDQSSVKVQAHLVSGELFGVLGAAGAGRTFTHEEDRVPGPTRGGDLLRFLEAAFARDPRCSAKCSVGNSGFEVIGVTPPEFHGILVGWDIDAWFPLTMQAQVLPGA